MAFIIEGEQRIAAPREVVWAALNDPEVLKACIPGCQSLEQRPDGTMAATVMLKIGPIKATFGGEVALSDVRPLEGYTISGEGKGGPAGFAKGGADVALADVDDGATMLTYAAKADIGGKIAQLGSRLIYSTAKNLSGQFFSEFERQVTGGGEPAEDAGTTEAEAPTAEGEAPRKWWQKALG